MMGATRYRNQEMSHVQYPHHFRCKDILHVKDSRSEDVQASSMGVEVHGTKLPDNYVLILTTHLEEISGVKERIYKSKHFQTKEGIKRG